MSDRAAPVEVTGEMIEAATKAMCEHASRHNIVTLDEMHEETIRLMVEAALSMQRGIEPV